MFKYLILLSGFVLPGLLYGQTTGPSPAAGSNIDSLTIRFCANHHCDGTPVTGVDVTLRLAYPGNDTVTINELAMGCRDFGPYPVPLSYTLQAEKNDQLLNGLNALDLHRIIMQILGIAILPSPFAQIAADANRSLSVTTFDLHDFRRLMQGIADTIPNNKSWMFIDQNYVFPNPNNPFSGVFPEVITVPDLSGQTDSIVSHAFAAIKIGDVDCSALPGLQDNSVEERAPAYIRIPGMTLAQGSIREIPVYVDAAGPCIALQADLAFDPEKLEVLDVLPGTLPGTESPVMLKAGVVNLLWYASGVLEPGTRSEVCRLLVRARQDVATSQGFRLDPGRIPAQAFGERSERYPLVLASDEEALSVRVFPNPGSANCTLLLSTPPGGKASLRVFSPIGTLLFERSYDVPAINLPAETFPGTGVYPFEIRQDGKVLNGRIVRI